MKQAKPLLTIGIILIVLTTTAISKQIIDLNDYDEECYEYQKIPYVANYTFQYYSPECWYWCFTCKCELINNTIFYNSTKNGDCIKFHLVRKVQNDSKTNQKIYMG